MVDKPLIAAAAAITLAGIGVWYYLQSRHAALPAATPVVQSIEPQAGAPAILHPLPTSTSNADAKLSLPVLDASDDALREALGQAAGIDAVKEFLLPESIVRRLVVTIDNLPRQKLSLAKRPTASPNGLFAAEGDELHGTLDPRNFARYEPMMAVIRRLDMRQIAAIYVRFYPLFQRAYQDLGYQDGYFNDRLVKVIDILLATPQAAAPIALTRPNVLYVFADPALESLAAGQKLLIRMGSQNSASIKEKLTELRAAVSGAPLKLPGAPLKH